MPSSKIALYAGGPMGPDEISQNLQDFENSGFNVLILGLCHIGRKDANGGKHVGDIIFNQSPILVHDGSYQLDSTYNSNNNNTLLSLKASGKVTESVSLLLKTLPRACSQGFSTFFKKNTIPV